MMDTESFKAPQRSMEQVDSSNMSWARIKSAFTLTTPISASMSSPIERNNKMKLGEIKQKGSGISPIGSTALTQYLWIATINGTVQALVLGPLAKQMQGRKNKKSVYNKLKTYLVTVTVTCFVVTSQVINALTSVEPRSDDQNTTPILDMFSVALTFKGIRMTHVNTAELLREQQRLTNREYVGTP